MQGMPTGQGSEPSDWGGFTDSQSKNFSDRRAQPYTDLDLFSVKKHQTMMLIK